MNASVDLELMRATLLLESDPAAAARCASAILANSPNNDAANLLLVAACRRLGDSGVALAVIEFLAHTHTASPFMHFELGRSYAALGRHSEAVVALERAVNLDASLSDAWRELASQRLRAGEMASADAAYATYKSLATEPPQLLDAYVALDSNRLQAAEALALQRLRAAPEDVATLRLLAAIASRRGDDVVAESTLLQVLKLEPCETQAREQLVRLLIRQGRIEEALPLIERLLMAQPRSSALLILKAESLRLAERHAQGLAIVEQLIADDANNADFWLIAGNQQRFIGKSPQAIESYQQAIALRPGYGEAYWALSNLKTLRFTPQDIDQMQRQLAVAPASGPDATYLAFALGKALEDEQQFEASFKHYERGNTRARAGFEYDPKATSAFVERCKAIFSAEFFAQRADWGNSAVDPIFIVGLPRSGSTLLEQILASHSQVEGTRELSDIPTIARQLAARDREGTSYPENLASLSRTEFDSLAARYLSGTRQHRLLGKPRFVDKMLGNFVSIGLIHLMFPQAVIIDSRRHALACCVSCYKQLFNPGMNFAYDLTELGLYYRDYVDLMRHVDTVLPGRVHRVNYESLVAGTELEVRRLLDHCGLQFEAQCLRFFDSGRVAQTISSEQVRLPVYTEAVDQWRQFEAWLAPLKAALGDSAAG